MTNEPSEKDSTPPPSLEEFCSPTDKDAPRLLDVQVLSADPLDISKADGTATIELLVRDKTSKVIVALLTAYTGKGKEYTSFEPDKECSNRNIVPNTPSILKCDIKLPTKKAPPGTYKIEVCVFAGGKKDFYSAARLEKEKLTFSFKVVKTDRL
jgi:hypothetical protein